MSLRLVRSLSRVASPALRRHISPVTIGQANCMSSAPSEKPPKAPKAAVKSKPPSPQETVLEKGDTYKAGETYFSFNPYSFYDIEKDMKPKRCEQPSSRDKAS